MSEINKYKKCKSKKCNNKVHVMHPSGICAFCPVKPYWQEEFEDKIQFSNWGDLDFLSTDYNIERLCEKFIGEAKQKVKVKCKGGMIQIERI